MTVSTAASTAMSMAVPIAASVAASIADIKRASNTDVQLAGGDFVLLLVSRR